MGGHAYRRVVDAHRVRLAAELAERSRGAVDEALSRRLGHRSTRAALAAIFGIRERHAGELLAIAASTTATTGFSGVRMPAAYPSTAAALDRGDLTLAQAQAIVQTLEQAAPRADVAELAWVEGRLVDAATDPSAPLGPELITVQARAYAAVLDPDGVLPGAERQRAMRSLRMGRRGDGMWHLSLVCPPEQGAAIKAVLDAYTGPRVRVRFDDPDADASQGDAQADDTQREDDRSLAQQQHDVLVGLVVAHARSGDAPTVGGEAPTLVLTGSIDALRAYLEGAPHRERTLRIEHTGDLLPIETIGTLLCDAAVQAAVVDDCHHVLALGREQRLFSRAQRRALAARDRGCRAPGCRMPPAWCEAHHIVPWQLGGPTDVDNGILLCAYHHHEVHAGRLRVERAGPRPGGWRVVSMLQPVRRPTPTTAPAVTTAGALLAAEASRPLAMPLPDAVLTTRPPSRRGSTERAAGRMLEHALARRVRPLARGRASRPPRVAVVDRPPRPRIVLRT